MVRNTPCKVKNIRKPQDNVKFSAWVEDFRQKRKMRIDQLNRQLNNAIQLIGANYEMSIVKLPLHILDMKVNDFLEDEKARKWLKIDDEIDKNNEENRKNEVETEEVEEMDLGNDEKIANNYNNFDLTIGRNLRSGRFKTPIVSTRHNPSIITPKPPGTAVRKAKGRIEMLYSNRGSPVLVDVKASAIHIADSLTNDANFSPDTGEKLRLLQQTLGMIDKNKYRST